MAGIFFKDAPVRNYEESAVDDGGRYTTLFQGLLKRGVYFAPSRFEALFLSSTHTEVVVATTVDAAAEVLREIGSRDT